MPLGPFGEVVGTTGTLEALGADAQTYRSKVIAPRNPKLVKGDEDEHKVCTTVDSEIFVRILISRIALKDTSVM